MTRDALELLSRPTPEPAALPASIEELNLAAFDTQERIRTLQDEAARREELATAEASAESNADRRKARRAELLRDDDRYHELLAEIQTEQRTLCRLQERAHRFAREHRLHVARCYEKAL